MSATTTRASLKKLAESVGATLEEDSGYRDMRVFQLVAPEGKRWSDNGGIHLRVELAAIAGKAGAQYNKEELAALRERVVAGLVPIPANEAYLYAED